jgi:hypothetical protein
LIDGAARRGVKELRVVAEPGYTAAIADVVWACERALERGVVHHARMPPAQRLADQGDTSHRPTPRTCAAPCR